MKIIAHGGYSAKYPENSLQSHKAAAKLDIDVAEMDVALSSDNVAMCTHPKTLLQKQHIDITKTSSRTLLGLKDSDGELLCPLLTDVIDVYTGRVALLLLDLKQEDDDLARIAIKTAVKRGIEERELIVGSRNADRLQFLRENFNVRILGLLQDPDLFEDFFKKGGDIYRLWEEDMNSQRVEAIHVLGKEVWVTPGHAATETLPRTAGLATEPLLLECINLMIDGVIVSDVEMALHVAGR